MQAVPYENCLLWQLSDYYFMQRGVQTWQEMECPFVITSNMQYAFQLAWVIHAGLKNKAELPEQIQMLEVAAGNGVFALFFLKAFSDVCQQERSDFFERLRYIVTDYSPRYVSHIAQNQSLAPLIEKGQVVCGVLDIGQAESYQDLQGKTHTLPPESIQAIFSNYLFDTLPVAVYQWRQDQLYKKWVHSEILTPQARGLNNAARPAHHFAIEDTLWVSDYRPCDLDTLEPWLQRQLKKLHTQNIEFLIPYSALSHQALCAFNTLLGSQGLLWIADMGFSDHPWWRKRLDFWPNMFGLCAAHNVNFPFFKQQLEDLGMSVFLNREPQYHLKLLLAQKSADMNASLRESFRFHFVTTNRNETHWRDHSQECLRALNGELRFFSP